MSVELSLKGDRTAFEPGETIRGTASWSLVERPRKASLSLVFYTTGKGDEDIGVVHTIDLPNSDAIGSESFEFALPIAPHSFSGRLISLGWALELNLGRNNTQRIDIVIAPGGKELELAEVEHDDSASSFFDKLRGQSS